MSDEDRLAQLLSAAAELEERNEASHKTRALVETDIFKDLENDLPLKSFITIEDKDSSLVHAGETDSSDDEQNRNCENQKYNESGKNIRFQLESTSPQLSLFSDTSTTTWKSNAKSSTNDKQLCVPVKEAVKADVYTDPVFGIRIVNPLISSTMLKERMAGRKAVSMTKVKKFVEGEKAKTDWVIAGVVVSKYVKMSQKGSPFCIWTLSDLHNDLKTVGILLFGSAYKDFWKTIIGTVVGILNPDILDKKAGSKDEVS